MVKKLFNFIEREISGLHEAAYLLAFFAIFSQVLGLIRDRLLAAQFGASAILDTYYASFRLPDILFVVFSSLVSASILVPYLSNFIEKKNKKNIKKIVDSLFTVFFLTIVTVSALVLIFTPQLLKIFVPGLYFSDNSEMLIVFTRILLLSPILLGVSQLLGGIVQAYRRFFIYAISPILYNLGIIVGIVFFLPIFGEIGLVYGVALGLVLHLIFQLPVVGKEGLIPKLTFKIDWPIVKKMMALSIPRTITLASSQIVLLVFVSLASLMAFGSITVFNFAYNLQSVPLSIIGVSYSLAAFPTLSRLFSSGNIDKFISQIVVAARHIIFWSFPVMVMFIVLRAQIVRTILGSGEFSWSDTRLTAAALALFSVSVLAQSLNLLFVRGYYSAGRTKKPLIIGILSSVITVFLAVFLINFFRNNEAFRLFFEIMLRVSDNQGTVVLMLPLAFSLGMILNSILLWLNFEKDFKGFSLILKRTFLDSLSVSLFSGYVSYLCLNLFDNFFDLDTLFGVFMQGFLSGIVGIVFGVVVLKLINNREVDEIWKALHRKIWKVKPITTGQEEL